MTWKSKLMAAVALGGLLVSTAPVMAQGIIVGLITKTNTIRSL